MYIIGGGGWLILNTTGLVEELAEEEQKLQMHIKIVLDLYFAIKNKLTVPCNSFCQALLLQSPKSNDLSSDFTWWS